MRVAVMSQLERMAYYRIGLHVIWTWQPKSVPFRLSVLSDRAHGGRQWTGILKYIDFFCCQRALGRDGFANHQCIMCHGLTVRCLQPIRRTCPKRTSWPPFRSDSHFTVVFVNADGHECVFVAVIASPVARHNIITYHSSFGSATNWVCPEGQDCQRSFGDGSYPSPSDCVFTISQDNRQEKRWKDFARTREFWAGLVTVWCVLPRSGKTYDIPPKKDCFCSFLARCANKGPLSPNEWFE